MNALDPTRPVLRYHGGKWLLAPWIISFFPPHRVYVEPYGGGTSVLLRKEAVYSEVYNDLFDEVVNVFRVLRDPATAVELQRLVELTPFARAEFDLSYQHSDDPVEQAMRTIARSFMGFGSASIIKTHATGFRSGSRRRGTPPAADWFNWPAQIQAFTARMRHVVIENRDAREVILQQDGFDTLHYVDPPYPHSTRGNAKGVRQKYAVDMTDEEHRQLAWVLKRAKGMVVLSGYPCELYDRELHADWTRFECLHLADGARPRTEVVWLNPACNAALKRARSQGCLLEVGEVSA